MRITLKTFVAYVSIFLAFFSIAPEIARCDSDSAPQIQVLNISTFEKGKPYQRIQIRSAVNTLTGEVLVIWKEHDGTGNWISGRLLSAKGRKTTKKIKSILPDCCLGLGVTFNPTQKEFLIVFKRNLGISGQRVDSQLKAVGNEFEIIPHTSQNENHHPSVIFNPHTNGYALAWDRTEGIAIALLDSAGKLTGSILPVMRNPGPNGYYDDWGEEHDGRDGHYYPRVLGLAYHPASDKLLLVFQQRFSPTEGDYWLATLDPALNNFHSSDLARINKNTVSFISDPYWDLYHPGWGLSLVILPKGSALVYYADSESVKRRQIDSKGKPSGKAFPAFSGALKNAHLFYPNVAFSTISSGTTGLLIAAMPDSWPNKTALYGQSLNSRGRPIGRPILLDHSDAFELVALPRNDSDKVLQYEYFQFGGELNPALCSGYCMSVVKVDVEVIP